MSAFAGVADIKWVS